MHTKLINFMRPSSFLFLKCHDFKQVHRPFKVEVCHNVVYSSTVWFENTSMKVMSVFVW